MYQLVIIKILMENGVDLMVNLLRIRSGIACEGI